MESIGQLFMIGIEGTKLTDSEKEFIEKENIGGVTLFKYNYESPAQLAELVNSIQALRGEYPLFIAVDQEGGRVVRFKRPFTTIPPMKDIGDLNSPKICFEIHKIIAEELSACGVNLNYSPVCDIIHEKSDPATVGDRSFGYDEEIVSKNITAAIRGLQTNGIMACAKHFPGLGFATKDSHYHLPIVKASIDEILKNDIKPFIKASKSRVEFVMTAHMMIDAIDDKRPMSLSPKGHKFLREQLKYNKIVITDDMQMQAITDNFGKEEAVVMALDAGADMVLYREFEFAKKALQSLRKGMKEKRLLNSTIDEKLARIQDCKKRNLSEYSPIYIPSIRDKINRPSVQTLMEEIGQKIQANYPEATRAMS